MVQSAQMNKLAEPKPSSNAVQDYAKAIWSLAQRSDEPVSTSALAEVLAHAISDELSERIAEALGNPTHDPHGDPIPTADGLIEERATTTLAELEPGAAGTFVRVSDSDPEMLRYLSERGISPGDSFEVLQKEPFDGPLSVRFGDRLHVLGGALTQAMRADVAA